MKLLLKAAWILGIAPLVLGVLIFLVWLVLRDPYLPLAGIYTLFAGICSIAAGTVCAAIYLWRAWRSKDRSYRHLVRQALGIAGLYSANFVVSAGIVLAVFVITFTYTVWVTNHSELPLHSARVHGAGVDISLGEIPPGQSVKASFWIEHDGVLVLTATHGTDRLAVTIEEVSNDVGGNKLVTFDASGEVKVTEKPPGLFYKWAGY